MFLVAGIVGGIKGLLSPAHIRETWLPVLDLRHPLLRQHQALRPTELHQMGGGNGLSHTLTITPPHHHFPSCTVELCAV